MCCAKLWCATDKSTYTFLLTIWLSGCALGKTLLLLGLNVMTSLALMRCITPMCNLNIDGV